MRSGSEMKTFSLNSKKVKNLHFSRTVDQRSSYCEHDNKCVTNSEHYNSYVNGQYNVMSSD